MKRFTVFLLSIHSLLILWACQHKGAEPPVEMAELETRPPADLTTQIRTSPTIEENDTRTGIDENFAEESRDENKSEPDGFPSEEDHPPGEITFSVFLYQPWYRKEIRVGLCEDLEINETLEVLSVNQWLQLTTPEPSFLLKWERVHSSQEDLELGIQRFSPDDFAEETALVYILGGTNGKANELMALPPRKEQPPNHFLLVNLTAEKLTWQTSDGAPTISPGTYLFAPLPKTNIRFQGSTSSSSLVLNRRSFASSDGIVLIMPPLRGIRGEYQYRLLQWPKDF
ncbi:MAG: hypothetical protein LAT55_09055 [Opitutales bacterium]|nr:hypothetical protein [Opitutales bacterium]